MHAPSINGTFCSERDSVIKLATSSGNLSGKYFRPSRFKSWLLFSVVNHHLKVLEDFATFSTFKRKFERCLLGSFNFYEMGDSSKMQKCWQKS